MQFRCMPRLALLVLPPSGQHRLNLKPFGNFHFFSIGRITRPFEPILYLQFPPGRKLAGTPYPNGIQMYVTAELRTVQLVLYKMRLESSLEYMPGFSPHPVHAYAKGCQQRLHEPAQVAMACLQIKMHVVGHKAVASDTDIEKIRELIELLQKQLIMPVRE